MTIPAKTPPTSFYLKTLFQGTGATVTSSEGVVGNYVSYDWSGTTHKALGSTFGQGTPSFFAGQILPGLQKAILGQKVGSRVVAVLPPADGFGSTGNSQAGIGADDSLVFVVDIGSAFDTASVPGKQASDGGGALPTVTPPAAGGTHGPTITGHQRHRHPRVRRGHPRRCLTPSLGPPTSSRTQVAAPEQAL